jgi:hypothetical protein
MFKSLLKYFKASNNVEDLLSEATRLIGAIESRLYSQETREGYLNSMKTLKTSREMLQILNESSEEQQVIFLKKMIKRLKPISKMKRF